MYIKKFFPQALPKPAVTSSASRNHFAKNINRPVKSPHSIHPRTSSVNDLKVLQVAIFSHKMGLP